MALLVEIEFSAGAWANVTADVRMDVEITGHLGRQTKLSTPTPSTLTLTLANAKGKYTPGLQVLSDGTAAPYWPNVQDGKRIRVSTDSGVRFVGPIQSWKPVLQNGVLCDMTVSAIDDMDRLSRVTLVDAITQEVQPDLPIAFYRMDDDSSSTSAVDYMRNLPDLAFVSSGVGTPAAFGGTGPSGIEGGGLVLQPSTDPTGDGDFLDTEDMSVFMTAYTIEMWVRPVVSATAAPSFLCVLLTQPVIDGTSPYVAISYDSDTDGRPVFATRGTSVTPAVDISDGHWHHLVMTVDSTGHQRQYIDGVAYGGSTAGASTGWRARCMFVGGLGGLLAFTGTVGPTLLYDYVLPADRVLAHYLAGTSWNGETTDQRLARLLGYAGLSSGGVGYGEGLYGVGLYGGADGLTLDLDTSTVVLNGYQQSGKDVLSACFDAVNSEGGGAVMYVLSGSLVFRNRDFRMPGPPVLTLNTQQDSDRSVFSPALDALALANQASVTRMSGAAQLETVTASDDASIAERGLTSAPSLTSWARHSPTERPEYLAQAIVAANGTPRYGFDQLAVDMMSAVNVAALAAAVADVEIGSRIRVVNLPRAAAPATQLDVLAEGWTERISSTLHLIVFDTSAADAPAWCIADDAAYGLAQADGHALAAPATAAATSLSVAAPAGGPLFTTAPGDLPFPLQLGAEVVTCTAVAGSSSPQTLTVIRGQAGTAAAAQIAGTAVELAPMATAAL